MAKETIWGFWGAFPDLHSERAVSSDVGSVGEAAFIVVFEQIEDVQESSERAVKAARGRLDSLC